MKRIEGGQRITRVACNWGRMRSRQTVNNNLSLNNSTKQNLVTLKEDLKFRGGHIRENENELALIDKISDLSTELESIRVQLDEERANLLGLKEELNVHESYTRKVKG